MSKNPEKIKFPVAVTGMGVLSAHGLGVPALSRALFQGNSQIKKSARFPMLSFPVLASELDQFNLQAAIKNFSQLPAALTDKALKIGRRSPFTIQTSLLAALEAWEQAQLAQRNIDLSRVGLIVAGENTTQGYQYQLHQRYQTDLSFLSPTYALHFMDTDQVGTLSEIFAIEGEGFTVGGASATGNVGIIQACRLIQQGLVDVCLVVGVLADLSPYEVQGFHNIGALGGRFFHDQPLKACRPFDVEHEGFIWGQASGCLVLEAAKFAKNAPVKILGHIAGSAMKLDANRLANPNIMGEIQVMQQALSNAGLTSNQIQYINTHGSSSPLGDETEAAAIKEVLGKACNQVWLNSTKSITGHCIWSAGIIEAIATLVQIQENRIHPNLNLENPIDKHCRFVHAEPVDAHIEAALSNSLGFGGINTSIVITRES